MSPATIAHAPAAAHLSMSDGQVMLLVMTGLVTTAALRGMRDRFAVVPLPEFRSYVVDWTRCVCAFERQALDDLVAARPDAPPGALLVQPWHLQLMNDHARRMAVLGITRRVFLDAREARAWADRQAALHPPR